MTCKKYRTQDINFISIAQVETLKARDDPNVPAHSVFVFLNNATLFWE